MGNSSPEDLSLGQIAGLLERLPNRGYLLQQAPGSEFNWDYLQHLSRMMFSGCTFARLPSGERSFLLHYSGKLIFANHYNHQGTIAAEYFLKEVSKATVSTFRVLPAVLILGIAPLMGTMRGTNLQSSLKTEALLESLQASNFSGTLVYEYLNQIQAWYLREGRLFQSQPFPPAFDDGALYLFDAPNEPNQDLMLELERPKVLSSELASNTGSNKAASSDQLWQIAQKVLDEYLGPSANMALERMRKDIRLEDLQELKVLVQKRLEAVLGRAAAQKFALLAKEL